MIIAPLKINLNTLIFFKLICYGYVFPIPYNSMRSFISDPTFTRFICEGNIDFTIPFLIVALDTNLSFLFWITSSNWYYNNITFIQYLQQLDINLSIFMRIAYILSLLIVYFDNFYSISLIFLCVYYIILLSV